MASVCVKLPYTHRESSKKKSTDTIDLGDKTGHLTRGARLTFGMIDSLCFPSLCNLMTKDELEDSYLQDNFH